MNNYDIETGGKTKHQWFCYAEVELVCIYLFIFNKIRITFIPVGMVFFLLTPPNLRLTKWFDEDKENRNHMQTRRPSFSRNWVRMWG